MSLPLHVPNTSFLLTCPPLPALIISYVRIFHWNNWSLLESFNLFPLFYFFLFPFIFVSQVLVIVVIVIVIVIVIVEGLLDWIYCVSSRKRVFFPWICVLS